ncbi:hypothetical protein HK097_004416, partial [Rhizophlyctis rosea]
MNGGEAEGTSKGIGDSSKQALFGNQEYTLEEAWQHRDKAIREFAMAYCFLLLLVSRNTQEPAKERMYFEYIYALSREVIVTVVSLPAFSTLLDTELNRLFRSDLFCGSDIDDSTSPSSTESPSPRASRLANRNTIDRPTTPKISHTRHRTSVRPDSSNGSGSRLMSR